MATDSTAFEHYRNSPNEKTTLLRLIAGSVVIVAFWMGMTFAVLVVGTWLFVNYRAAMGDLAGTGPVQDFLASPAGILSALFSFSGIWLGAWVAMRFIHKERLSALFGATQRISGSGFIKGLIAVIVTSLLSEVALYLLHSGMARGPVTLSLWLLFLIPVVALTFLQTSSEELLFRGYLLRGLARLFRSPLAWTLVPGLIFVSLHYSPEATPAINASVLVSIAAFTVLLTLLVYRTGNLGACFGAHMGNNLTGFLLISHQKSYNAFALFNAPSLEDTAWTTQDAVVIAVIGVVSSLLTITLLLHPASPLRVESER